MGKFSFQCVSRGCHVDLSHALDLTRDHGIFYERDGPIFLGAIFKNNRSVAFCYRNFDFGCKNIYLA